MAEALVGVLVEQLASLAFEHTKGTVTLVLNAKEDVHKFSRKLKALQCVLEDAEKQQVKDSSVRNWLDRLEDVSYQMVDILDEWNSEILKQQVEEEKQEHEGENVLVTKKKKKKVCFLIPFNCFKFGGYVHTAIQHYNIAKKIEVLNEMLDSISADRRDFSFHQSSIRSIDDQLKLLNEPRQKTTHHVNRSAMLGREKAESNLLSKLIPESSQKAHRLLIIPIVGMGGIGKTTLAQLAYNNEKVRSSFDKRIWVCVSDPFDEVRIAKAIVRGTGTNTPDSNELEEILESMSRFVEGKKVLIVLDDVWTEDKQKWENLKLPVIMQSSAEGSKIIVTTRKEGVAKMMGVTTDQMIHIEALSYEVCVALFNSIAFWGREKDESSEFGAIGRKLVERCKGLPLAVRSLGELMHSKTKIREWKEVLNNKMWDLEQVEQEVFRPLLLSYFDLSPIVKRCLLYCATFPKDHEFDKHMLIELWMSQDYLNRKENTNKEAIGEQIFNNLVMRSFFQDVAEEVDDEDYSITISCKMHDLIHDLMQFLSKNECCTIEVEDANTRTEVRSESSVRHLTLMSTDESDQLSSLLSSVNCKMLRTLSTLDSRITGVDSKLIILQLKCVRTLNLRANYISELPEEIGSLVHLRYLDLSKNRDLEELPASLCNLYNLETLRLVDCWELEKLPEKMGNLINLRHLHIWHCGSLEYLPKGIGRLTNLKTLDWCPVTDSGVNEAFKLGDLGSLDQLQGNLFIAVHKECQLDTSGAENSALLNKKLSYFGIMFEDIDAQRNAGIVNLLRPHEDLESLYIGGYNGITYPNWMMPLHSLRFLSLFGWSECEFLPPLGKLPCLEKLQVYGAIKLKTVGDEFLGMESSQASSCKLFPKLKELSFNFMPEWQQWGGVGGCEESGAEITIMPCLSSFSIYDCPKLSNLPVFLRKTPVRKIFIMCCRRSIIVPVWPENSDVNIEVKYPIGD